MSNARKLAILVLAHKDSDHLNRLLGALEHPDIDVYVHVDAKQDDIFRKKIRANRAMILPREESFYVNWGDVGFPFAALKLMKMASSQAEYNYYLLISGQDYPIRPMPELLDYLSSDDDYLNFVEGIRFDSRYLLYYPHWLIGKETWKRLIRGVYKCLGMGPLACLLQRRNRPFNKPYCGSSWWAFRGKVVNWILAEIDRDPRWLSFYSNSLNPDEGLFQTLYMNSPYVGQNKEIMTYIDWSANGPSPDVLSEKDFASIVRSKKFFARKMETGLSDVLLDMVDGAVLTKNKVDSFV